MGCPGTSKNYFSSTHEHLHTHEFSSTGGALFPHLSVYHHGKGQLISKGLFGVIRFDQKNNKISLRISALAFKKSSNQKTLLYNHVK